MIRASYIARIPDGLPLIAAMGNDQLFNECPDYKSHFKQITTSICNGSLKESQCVIDTGGFSFHVQVDRNIAYLCLTTKSIPRKDAAAFLNSVVKAFRDEYSDSQIDSCNRPFSLLSFGTEYFILILFRG